MNKTNFKLETIKIKNHPHAIDGNNENQFDDTAKESSSFALSVMVRLTTSIEKKRI